MTKTLNPGNKVIRKRRKPKQFPSSIGMRPLLVGNIDTKQDRGAGAGPIKKRKSAEASTRDPFQKQQQNHALHDIREELPGFESNQDCKKELLIRQKALIKAGYHDLAEKLADCTGNYRCMSPACPQCVSINRERFYVAAMALSDLYSEANQRTATLVYYNAAMKTRQLKDFKPIRLKNRLSKQLIRSGFMNSVIGGIELDYNEAIKRWIPHFHVLVLNDIAALKVLRKYFKKEKRSSGNPSVAVAATTTGYISRPVLVQRLKDRPEQVSYLCKQSWQSIYSYRNKEGKRKTSKRRLDKRRFPLSLRILDQLNFGDLLFLYKTRVASYEFADTSCQRDIGNKP